jgi:uncharacterized protein with von Willebrand factor type A (vWA) domain
MAVHALAWRYGRLTGASGCAPDADALFRSMTEDLLRDGNVERAMQKAFRWGYEDDEGQEVPGLKDIIQRVRDEGEQLHDDLASDALDADEASTPDRGREHENLEDETLDVAGRVEQMETMERSLKQIESLEDLQNLDPQLIDSVLTDDEREWVEQWMAMTGQLIERGLVVEGSTRLELTPEAIRRIGMHALRALHLTAGEEGTGEHELHTRGLRGPTTDTSSPWQFGQPFSLHLTRTILNAVYRQGPGHGIRLQPEDFEALDRESTAASATVLLVDLSRSMFHNGCWDAAKQSAMALDALMRSQFPRDVLEIVGFSNSAERLHLRQLPSLTWDEYSHGTNLQAGLRLARLLLRDYGQMNRHIIVITDGEPTAFNDTGGVIFENPATQRTFDATMSEVVRCSRDRIAITTFLLDDSPELIEFVRQMTRVNRGRIIQTAPGRLGRYLIRDFAAGRTTVAGG